MAYTHCQDQRAMEAFDLLTRSEGILPALESSHAVAVAIDEARIRPAGERIVVCLSGRGDKDSEEIARLQGEPS